MSKPWKAWGACEHCDFIGDMWFRKVERASGSREFDLIAACPVCLCDTPVDDMPEYPAAEVEAELGATEVEAG